MEREQLVSPCQQMETSFSSNADLFALGRPGKMSGRQEILQPSSSSEAMDLLTACFSKQFDPSTKL